MLSDKEYLEALKEDMTPHLRTAIAATALLLTIFKSAKAIHTLYYSKAAKACQGKKIYNRDKANCIIAYKKEALAKQIQSLESNQSRCSKTTDPKKCTSEIESKVLKLKKKRSLLGK